MCAGTSREISGVSISNELLGQEEAYSSAKFVKLSMNCVYAEMCRMFLLLRYNKSYGEDHFMRDGIAKDSFFGEYRFRGPAFRSLNLYDYRSIVYTKSSKANSDDNYFPYTDGFRSSYVQGFYTDINRAPVPSLTGRPMTMNNQYSLVRSRAIMLGLFVPWEDIKPLGFPDETFASVFDHMMAAGAFSARIIYHIKNIELLKKSAEDCAVDRRNFRAKLAEDGTSLAIDDSGQIDLDMEEVLEDAVEDSVQAALRIILSKGQTAGSVSWKGLKLVQDSTNLEGFSSGRDVEDELPASIADTNTCRLEELDGHGK